MMKETGIIMSGDHPTKILDGTKTMTRRTWGLEKINKSPDQWFAGVLRFDGTWSFLNHDQDMELIIKCPYGGIGDLLWVRETWTINPLTDKPIYKANYDKTFEKPLSKWKPSIHMFRKDSRIQMPISSLRPERLNEMSIEDARAEGFNSISGFAVRWNELNGKRGYAWNDNKWVWLMGWGTVGVRLK